MLLKITQFEKCERASLVGKINKEEINPKDKLVLDSIIQLCPDYELHLCKHKQGNKCEHYHLVTANLHLCRQSSYF